MKANIKLALFSLTPVLLLALIRNVIAKLTGNAFFPDPPVKLSDMTTLADKLEGAIEDATNGNRNSKLVRNQLVLDTRNVLRTTSDYVRMLANGDAVMLESSGFELTKQRTPVGIPGKPAGMNARMTGLTGQVELKWPSVHGAYGYQVWMTDKDPAITANWEPIGYTTRVKHVVTELESYKAYFFCVSAIGAAGEGAQSDPAVRRAA